jgi:hypothetical protein
MYLPNVCVDNFFNYPNKIIDYAMSHEFYSCPGDTPSMYDPQNQENLPLGYWPGKRTKPLHILDLNFFNILTKKIMTIFFNPKYISTEYSINSYFQLIEPNQHKDIKEGWIHTDRDAKYAGVIYLNPDIDLECGTSLYQQKVYELDLPRRFIKARNLHYSENFSEKDIPYIKEQLQLNNSYYEETVRFNAVYNRLIGYDSSSHHGVRNYHGNSNKTRLTLVFFMYSLKSDWFPITELKRIPL